MLNMHGKMLREREREREREHLPLIFVMLQIVHLVFYVSRTEMKSNTCTSNRKLLYKIKKKLILFSVIRGKMLIKHT